jgi:hypothetical protein
MNVSQVERVVKACVAIQAHGEVDVLAPQRNLWKLC